MTLDIVTIVTYTKVIHPLKVQDVIAHGSLDYNLSTSSYWNAVTMFVL